MDLVQSTLPRPQLDQVLDQMLQYPLSVVRAPMGFGKTTAVRIYLQKNQLDAIYLPLLGSGNSPAYFWERLTARVSKREPLLGGQLVQLGFPGNGGEAAKIVNLLLDYTIQAPFFLVIDDYHLLECPQVVDFLCLLAGEQIPNLHIVLLTREIRLLPEADLRQKRLACSITQEDLRFQPQEVAAYFEMLHLPISAPDAQRIAQWTGGWISGIYLIARDAPRLLLENHSPSIDELLERNLYHTYPPASRRLLERLAFLDAFTPELVAEVFDSPDAPDTLQLLLQGNAFLSYKPEVRGYQMTDLLREFLQQKARQNGFDPRELYRRTGEWFLKRDKRTLAYTYFYRAGEITPVLESLNREDVHTVGSAQFELILRIFQDVPDSVYYQYPLAALQYIRAQAFASDRGEVRLLDGRLRQMEEYFLTAPLPETRRSRILGEINNTWVLVAFNDARSMVEHAAKAVRYFNGSFSCLISNDTEFTFGAASILYSYYNQAGTLWETTQFISRNFHILGQAVKDCGSGSESLVLAEYALETGDFDAVSDHAMKALYQARMYHQVDIELCATFTLCRLLILQGDAAGADRLMSQMTAMVELENTGVLNTTAALCSAYLDCCLGRTDHVPGWLRENANSHGSFLYAGMGFHHVVTGFAALLEGRHLQLEIYCDSFEKDWSIYNNQMGFLFGRIFRAGARAALYGAESGALALCAALDIAVQDNIIFPLAENARAVLPLLSHPLIRQRYPSAYLERLESCCRRYLSALNTTCPSPVLLTGREQEILHLLSQGLRHDEIAAQLFISVPTVRYHVKNIYQKLGVNNKLTAIGKARELHLLP